MSTLKLIKKQPFTDGHVPVIDGPHLTDGPAYDPVNNLISAPSGDVSTWVIAAADAPQRIKDRADDVCTGVNDHIRINAAIQAGYKKIRLTQGTFDIRGEILVDKHGQILKGTGSATSATSTLNTRLYVPVGSAPASVIHLYKNGSVCDKGRISDMWIVGGSSELSLRATNGIYFESANGWMIDNVRVYCCTNNFHLKSSHGNSFYSVEGSYGDYGVYFEAGLSSNCNAFYRGSFFNNNMNAVRGNDSGTDELFDVCIFQNTGLGAILANVGFTHLSITNSYFENNNKSGAAATYDIYCVTVTGSLVIKNNYFNNSGAHIDCFIRTSNYARAVSIENNYSTVHANTYDIYLSGVTGDVKANSLKNWYVTGDGAVHITGNHMSNGTVTISNNAGLRAVFEANDFKDVPAGGVTNNNRNTIWINNKYYIGAGEVRTTPIVLAPGAQNSFAFSWQNPNLQQIMILEVMTDITGASTGASSMDIGTAPDAVTHSNDIQGGIVLNAIGTSLSVNRVKLDATGGANSFITGQILGAAADGVFAGKVYIKHVGL